MDINPRQLLKFMLLPLVMAGPVERLKPSSTVSLNPVQNRTIHARDEPSAYPYGDAAPGEFLWLGWDPENKDQRARGEKIHAAFIEWGEMAKAAAKESAKHDSDIVKRWFNKQDDPKETENVFANMWDVAGDKPAAPVAKMVLEQTDFVDPKKCSASVKAYTIEDTGHFHVCPSGDNLRLNKDIKCEELDASCSAKMRSLPMTLLHEMTHYTNIGTVAHGGLTIIDIKPKGAGAYDCFKLDTDDKGDNAQNYAWFAGDVYWGGKCNKKFEDPAVDVKAAVGEDEAPPASNGPSSAQCFGSGPKFNADEAKKAIQDFCNDPNLPPTAIVPLISFGTGQTSDGRGKALGNTNEGVSINSGANTLWLGASFAEDTCLGVFQFGGDSCITQLNKIIDDCPGDVNSKQGGWIQDVCAVYRVIVTNPGDPNPMYIQAVNAGDDMGDWVCNPTDTSAIPDAGLDGTCTCFYSNQATMTDLFDPPKAGDCGSVPKGASPKIN